MPSPPPSPPPSEAGLTGRTVLLTRPQPDGECRLTNLLERAGATVISFPVLEFRPPESPQPLFAALQDIGQYGGIVFASRTGVRFFRAALGESPLPTSPPLRIAIGPGTAEAMAAAGIPADYQPEQSDSENLAELLIQLSPKLARPLLVLRAEQGSPLLGQRLSEAGVPFEEVIAYRSCPVSTAPEAIIAALKQERVDWLPLTSSLVARTALELLGRHFSSERPPRIASLGPQISTVICGAGYQPTVEASEPGFSELVAAMQQSR